jgi:hypothetical protein
MTDEIIKIGWTYHGATRGYQIYMNDEQIHFAKTEYDRDMFIADLKARILLINAANIKS